MFIESANFKLKLEEFQKVDPFSLDMNETEEKVFRLVKTWMSGNSAFTFKTSGSTGSSKIIHIDKQKIELSTKSTFEYLDIVGKITNTLLCLDPNFIGGAMVVFRALIRELDLYIVEPTSDVISQLPANFTTDLVSMVPMQFRNLTSKEIDRFKTILIGGAPMEVMPELKSSSRVFSTYGMTETVSHVALREIDKTNFNTIGDMKVGIDENECLKFKGEITDNKWLVTNDLGKVSSPTSFEWIGRKDFIINSGGVKLNPETIEQKLSDQIDFPFIITSIPDEKLSEKVVLILEGDQETQIDFTCLDKYEKPKLVLDNQTVKLTTSGKVDRIATREALLNAIK